MATKNDIAALTAQIAALTALVTQQQEALTTLATKKGGAKKKDEGPKRPEGLPIEPSSFKVPNGGPFGLYVPDGWAGISKTQSPPTDQAIPVNKRDRDQELGFDGLYPVSETRYYVAGSRGWKRAKKDGGWVSYFPKKVEVVEAPSADYDFIGSIDEALGE
jgi:hypothetical protein